MSGTALTKIGVGILTINGAQSCTTLNADGRFTFTTLPEPDGKRRIRIEEVAAEKIVAERTTDLAVAAALFSADGARCY